MSENQGRSCPKCKRDVTDAGDRCPHCGARLSGSDSRGQGCRPVVFVILGLVLLLPGACTAYVGASLLLEGSQFAELGYLFLPIGAVAAIAGFLVIRTGLRSPRK